MRHVRGLAAGVAAGALMLMTAGAASATEPQETLGSINYGAGWTFQGPVVVSTQSQTPTTTTDRRVVELNTETRQEASEETRVVPAYSAQVQQPINPDGSSVWPAKRGVIPVQFKLTQTDVTEEQTTSWDEQRTISANEERTITTTPVHEYRTPRFESVLSDASTTNNWSALSYKPSSTVTVSDLTELRANYSWLQGSNGGGSLRWSIRLASGKAVFVYYGPHPSFAGNGGPGSGDNLLAQSDARFDLTQAGGPFYGTKQDMLALVGGQAISSVSLVMDSGWAGDQRINLVDATVRTVSGVSNITFGAVSKALDPVVTESEWTQVGDVVVGEWAKVGAESVSDWTETDRTDPTQTNEPPATIQVRRFNEGDSEAGAVMAPLSSAQGDPSGAFRQVDGKYLYNLSAESLGRGDFNVYLVIDGEPVEAPGIFSLK